MVTKSRYAALFNPSECDAIPMDVDDDRPGTPGISMAQVLENQCVTMDEINEIIDCEEWNK